MMQFRNRNSKALQVAAIIAAVVASQHEYLAPQYETYAGAHADKTDDPAEPVVAAAERG